MSTSSDSSKQLSTMPSSSVVHNSVVFLPGASLWLLIGVYVDDLIITGSSKKVVEIFKDEMMPNSR